MGFNLTGWVWRRLRKIHLLSMILVGMSWGVLGIWYGFGYCPCTDWHWQVLEHLGYQRLPRSYVTFLIVHLTGIQLNPDVVDIVVLVLYILLLLISIYLNIRDYQRRSSV